MPEDRGLVEAVIFSAGKPVNVEQIAESTKLGADRVAALLRSLKKAYNSAGSALEIAQIGNKWTIQIREEYVEKARFFAPPELPPDIVKTAALIAYHQPVRQSDLGDMIGEKVYEHVKTLTSLNLVTAKPQGRTLSLTTSRHFPEFFGLKATARGGIKRLMAERAGMTSHDTAKKAPEADD